MLIDHIIIIVCHHELIRNFNLFQLINVLNSMTDFMHV